MDSKITIIALDHPHTGGLVIEASDLDRPIAIFPPEPGPVEFADWLDEERIVLVAKPTYKRVLHIYNVRTGTFERTAIVEKLKGSLEFCPDKRFLLGRDERVFSFVRLDEELVCRTFATAVWSETKDVGRLTNFDEFFHLDLTRSGDARVFQSDQLRTLHAQLLSEDRLRLPKLGKLAGITETGQLRFYHDRECVDAATTKRFYEIGHFTVDLDTFQFRRIINRVTDWHWSDFGLNLGVPALDADVVMRSDNNAVSYSSGCRQPPQDSFGVSIPEVESHRDIVHDGSKRYGLVRKIWDVSQRPLVLETITVRLSTAEELLRLNQDATRLPYADAALEFEMALRAYPNNAELKAREPKYFTASKIGGDADRWIEAKFMGGIDPPAQLQCALATAWEAKRTAFWVLFPDACVRRVAINGDIGPLLYFEDLKDQRLATQLRLGLSIFDGSVEISIGSLGIINFPTTAGMGGEQRRTLKSGEYTFRVPTDHKAILQKAAESVYSTTIMIEDLSEDACNKGIFQAAERVRWQLDRLIVQNALNFNFSTPAGALDEKSFYALIVDREMNVANALRELLCTYIAGVGTGEGNNPWCDLRNAVAGLGYALRALVLLDPTALDVFRAYAAKRDGEHEGYCCRVIFPEYVARHGLKDEAAIRFGVYLTINQMWGGLTVDRVPFGLMDAAKEIVPPKRLCEILMQEIEGFNLKPQWNDQTKEWYRNEFCRMLDMTDPYQQAILATIVRQSHGGLMSRVIGLVSSLFGK